MDGPVVAVVGASSGIGRAVAARFLDQGATVAVVARRGALLEALIAEHRPGGEGAWACPGDATDPACAEALISGTVSRFGRLDVLVLNTGLNIKNRALTDLTIADWDRMRAANLDAAFHPTFAALPQLRRQGGGLLIYISSVGALYADGSGAAYQAAKHALTGLANAVRVEEQRNGIRVSVIYPALVNTPLVDARPVPPTAEERARALQPEDVAAACAFIAAQPAHVSIPHLEMRSALL